MRIARAATTTKVTFTELPSESNRLQAAAVLEAVVVGALVAVVAQDSVAALPREAGRVVVGRLLFRRDSQLKTESQFV